MTPATIATRKNPTLIGTLMLGAALTLLPLAGHAQTATPAPAADAAATPSNTTGTSGAATGTSGAASDTAAPGADANATSGSATADGSASAGVTTDAASVNAAQAAATVLTAEGKEAGSVTLSETPSGALRIILQLSGMPAGTRAVHLHETGKCEAPTFESAGGHVAGGKEHGVLTAGGMHTGDLPNIAISNSGSLSQEFFIPNTKLADVMDEDGAAFVVHEREDDYVSQPSGKAGDRVACGVFEATKASN